MKTYTFRKSLMVAGALFTVVLVLLSVFAGRIETKLAEAFCALVTLCATVYMASVRFEICDESICFRAFGTNKVFPFEAITSVKKFQEGNKPAVLEVKSKEDTLLIQWYIAGGDELISEICKRVPHVQEIVQ